jgi:tartrate-resistant acid phosphatase type 5
LISQCDSPLRRYKVDLYLSGHDLDLQHLEFKEHPTSFVISGVGGAEPVGWTIPLQERGQWGLRALEFTDLQISKKELVVRHIGKDASVRYEFKKPVDLMRTADPSVTQIQRATPLARHRPMGLIY